MRTLPVLRVGCTLLPPRFRRAPAVVHPGEIEIQLSDAVAQKAGCFSGRTQHQKVGQGPIRNND